MSLGSFFEMLQTKTEFTVVYHTIQAASLSWIGQAIDFNVYKAADAMNTWSSCPTAHRTNPRLDWSSEVRRSRLQGAWHRCWQGKVEETCIISQSVSFIGVPLGFLCRECHLRLSHFLWLCAALSGGILLARIADQLRKLPYLRRIAVWFRRWWHFVWRISECNNASCLDWVSFHTLVPFVTWVCQIHSVVHAEWLQPYWSQFFFFTLGSKLLHHILFWADSHPFFPSCCFLPLYYNLLPMGAEARSGWPRCCSQAVDEHRVHCTCLRDGHQYHRLCCKEMGTAWYHMIYCGLMGQLGSPNWMVYQNDQHPLPVSKVVNSRDVLPERPYSKWLETSRLVKQGYLASGTSYAPWFHMGIIHHLITDKYPEIFDMSEPQGVPQGRALSEVRANGCGSRGRQCGDWWSLAGLVALRRIMFGDEVDWQWELSWSLAT